jgi:pectin methylesterase-like acyl-CoA thioesterase
VLYVLLRLKNPMFFFRSKKLIVSQGESGCYQSISEAIHDASPDATILVRRGNYQESIIIDKPLTIIGDGLRGDIVITGTDKNCITMQTHLSSDRLTTPKFLTLDLTVEQVFGWLKVTR